MFATALVDYDNACKLVKPERSVADVTVNLDEFLRAFSGQVSRLVRGIEAVTVRFYGGWRDRTGQLTDRGTWVLSQMSSYRTRLNSVRIIPIMVESLVVLPEKTLIGTFRPDLNPPQKLVDGMLTVDSITIALRDEVPLLIVSDDDDFVPAAIASVYLPEKRRRIFLVRRQKTVGIAPNDRLLAELNITLALC